MSFSDMFYGIMHSIRPLVRVDAGDRKSVLAVGAQDFFISEHLFRKLPIKEIAASEIRQLYSQYDPVKFSASSKQLLTKLFSHFGYAEYRDLDIYSRADIVFDLNNPLPEQWREKFDLVLDSTSNYVSDVRKAYENTSEMCKVGGLKMVNAMIGDQTNRFDMNPSPNYILDLHLNSGFVLEWSGLANNSGKILPYRRIANKSTKLPQLLPLADYLKTWLRQLAWALFVERPMMSKLAPVPLAAAPAAPVVALAAAPSQSPRPVPPMGLKGRLAALVKGSISPARLEALRQWRTLRGRRRNQWMVRRFGDQWSVVFVLRKVAATTAAPVEITPHYRALDETRTRSAAQ